MRITLTILLFFSVFEAFGQHATFANEKFNKAYKNLSNPISITVEGYSYSDLVVTTNNGEITKNEKEHNFILKPNKSEPARITVTSGKGTKELASYTFRVYNPPPPYSKMFGQQGDSVSIKKLKTGIGLYAPLDNFDYVIRYQIDSFTLTVVREGKTLNRLTNPGAKFSPEVLELIAQVQPGDNIIIDKASVTAKDIIHHDLDPITVRVVVKGKWDDVKEEEY